MESLPPRRPSGDLDLLSLVFGAFGGFFEDSDIVGDILGFLGEQKAEIVDLQEKTQVLEGVIGYGCLSSTGTSGTGSKARAPFTAQIGPLDPVGGVTRTDQGFLLNSKGLWRADVMQYFDNYTLGFNQIDCDIRVYAPNGSLFEQSFNHGENAGAQTLTSIKSFAVPAAGYKVQVWVQAAIGRGILGGNAYSNFNVTKISGETS